MSLKLKYHQDDWMFEDKELQATFQEEYVIPIMTQGWALDEVQTEEDFKILEEKIWEDYEEWAWKYLEDARSAIYE